jgi:hypothetical protein
MNNVAANTKVLRAALSGLNVRVRIGTGCREGHIHVDMKFGSDRAQRIAAFEALSALNAVAFWGGAPKAVASIFTTPHYFDSVSVISFSGAQ